jgi:hypothetical protein
MKHDIYVVTGAPGAGKSTTIMAFLSLKSEYIAFDIDWLAVPAGTLANKNIFTDPSTWKPYAALWFEVIHSVHKNHKTPVFFSPNTPSDFEHHGMPDWCGDVNWLLLDCDDQIRSHRLAQRKEWDDEMIQDAISDAVELRNMVSNTHDTGTLTPEQVATEILNWLEK